MAMKMGHTVAPIVALCVVLFLSWETQYALGFTDSGASLTNIEYSINIYNGADQMTIQNTYTFNDGTPSRTDPAQPLPASTTYRAEAADNVSCVKTLYNMPTASGEYSQTLNSWCREDMPIICDECYWVVDMSGFSIAASSTAPLLHAAYWNKP